VVSDASLLLLDEPTASLDPDAAAGVVAAIRHASAGRTVVLVTHDPLLADLADRVIRLDRPPGGGLSALTSDSMREEVST
jgi:ABC-type lipoprotein export system ATPase subunit